MYSVQQSIATAIIGLSLAAIPGAALAQQGHPGAHEHFCDPETNDPVPVLATTDFDGDGTVTDSDLQMLQNQINAGDYVALFDVNADGALDDADVEMGQAQMGEESALVDQQLARAYQGTKDYTERQAAVDDGYIPATQRAHGHGTHWIEHPKTGSLSYGFEAGDPAGLNYDAEGNLWAVFYYVGSSPRRPDGSLYPPGQEFRPLAEAPEGFAGHQDVWHLHAGACFEGLNYQNPTLDPSKLNFKEGRSPKECFPTTDEGEFDRSSTKWNAKFYMLHAWIYEQNPCGTFAGAHPKLATDATDPADALKDGIKIDARDPHPDFPFQGGTLCAWLTELGEAPEFCARGG